MIRKFYNSDFTVGARLQLDGEDAKKSLKQIKQDIKDAQSNLIAMQETFGETSKEAITAAKRVNQLKDQIKDANEVADLFDPGKKFQAVTNAVNGLVGGFTALTGAMSLLGVESEDVQKQILKVQSALALSQGLSTIADSAKDFKRLGDVIVNTLGKNGAIGLAIAGVTALGVAIWQTLSRNKQLEEAQRAYNKSVVEARVEVVKVQDAFRQARMGLISKDEALKQYNNTIGQTVGQAKTLNEAEQLTAKNAGNYIKVQGLKAKANFLLAESAKISGEAEIARIELQNNPALAAASFGGFEGKIQEAEAKAVQLQNVVAGIESQIKDLSKGFTGVSTSGNKATTAAGVQKEKEIQELDMLGKFLEQQERERLRKSLELRDIAAVEAKAIDDRRLSEVAENLRLQTVTEEQLAAARIEIAERERQAKVQAAYSIGNALGSLADLVGKQTAAGKVLGIAQATINTFIGATEVLRAKSVLPEPFGTIAKIANVAAIIASGLSAVKNIVKVQVPGYSAGGGGNTGAVANAPLTPQLPQSTRTRLEQDQINQIGNATVRAFVVESDVTNNQERIRRLNRAARL